MVSIKEALDIIEKNISSVNREIIPIEDGIGRVLAKDYIATYDLPRFDNSAMDGYAIKVCDSGRVVNIEDIIYAGDRVDGVEVKEGFGIKIMTGAIIPNGSEAVVPIEDITKLDNNRVKLPENIKPNSMIRFRGEDIKSGEKFLFKHQKLNGYSIALLASQGITHIEVFRRVRVVIFGTGEELKAHYESIEPHQLYNSNSLMFYGRAKELGCEVSYLNIAKDSLDSLKEQIRDALNADIILTSGGISVGDRDYTIQAFMELGMEILFSKVDIKPGKPTTFGKIGNLYIINLPGNPLASAVNFEIFVKPAILQLSGIKDKRETIKAKLKESIKLKREKDSAILGIFDGEYFLPLKSQKPGMISPLGLFNALLLTKTDIKEGSIVSILPL
jgi:molybdopterin molybdotransferase